MSSASLPDASSPSLILTQPTSSEQAKIWSSTHPIWGAALAHDQYLNRERYLTTIPLAKNQGITHWILTDASSPPDFRPIYASCESLRKPALSYSPKDDKISTGISHGIASVFTQPQYRGQGYASRMMADLGPRLGTWQDDDTTKTLFSLLYSDIGKQFYAKNGWAAFESAHLSFPPVEGGAVATAEGGAGSASTLSEEAAKPIMGFDSLEELCASDEKLLRKAMVERAKAKTTTTVAVVPSLDQILWHMYREDFVTKAIFDRTPTVRGAIYGSEPGKRVWALWMRGYYGGIEKIEGNTLHILRFVIEDEIAKEEEEVVKAIKSIVQVAQREAADWKSADVQMWNPDERLRGLVERSGLEHKFVDRESDSISSLMWYGEGATSDVDWVYNEKFAWC